MASTLTKIDIHLIFHVKTTSVPIKTDDLRRAFSYIGGIIKETGGLPLEIGGMPDHIHILTSLPKTVSLSDFVQIIKSNSSKWIKTLGDSYHQFSWQEGYGAFSVSPSLIDKTVKYIRGQEEHHKKRTFKEEYILFLESYGIQYDEKYICNE